MGSGSSRGVVSLLPVEQVWQAVNSKIIIHIEKHIKTVDLILLDQILNAPVLDKNLFPTSSFSTGK